MIADYEIENDISLLDEIILVLNWHFLNKIGNYSFPKDYNPYVSENCIGVWRVKYKNK